MRYKTAYLIEQELWAMKWADLPRATNRALIDELINGDPPFPDDERGEKTNVNFLEAAKMAHDFRRQLSNAHLKPGNFFAVKCDYGPTHKRDGISTTITTEINRLMKRSLFYRETLRNVFAQVVVHGIGPVNWPDRDKWCPSMQMVPDVLVPSRTLLTMENLTKFAVRRRYTAEQLYSMTHKPHVDKGWNMPVVDAAIKWAKEQLPASTYSADAYMRPEQFTEDLKENPGYWSSDAVQTIDCWDFYFLEEAEKEFGWKRRIVLDCESPPGSTGGIPMPNKDTKSIIGGRNQFLYDSGNRTYAPKLDEIMHFQFADGSSIAPFRYHNVRSLGFLTYSVCHLQNRLRCKFNDSVFESLMQFFRITSMDDAERITKLALIDRGVVPEGFNFIPQSERWQINMPLLEMAFQQNRRSMQDLSSSYTQDYDFARDKREKTATEVTAEVTATSALVASMLQESYAYQEFQYREIARRFCRSNSKDKDVKEFRLACLKAGVPEEALDVQRWDISADRIIGAGNKQMELGQIQLLMENYGLFGPDAQRIILRKKALAATDDPSLALELVPTEQNKTSNARHDAQLAFATLMMGGIVDVVPSMNHIDYVEAMLGNMTLVVQGIEQAGGMATKEQIIGLQNVANHLAGHIQIIAQNDQEKGRVRQYNDDLAEIMNYVKAYEQRLQEQMGEQGQNGNGEAQAKIQSDLISAQAKADILKANAALKMQQKQQQFAQKTEQSQSKHEFEMANRIRETQVQEAALDLRTAGEITRQSAKSDTEPAE